MAKWNLIVDVAECHNCHNCVVAARDELAGNDFAGYTAPHAARGACVIRIERHVRGSGHHLDAAYLPRLCNHCDEAPCVQAGAGAVRKRDDGIVIFDPEACRGRRDLVDACPYGAVVWNEEQQRPQNWFFDAHLLDGGWHEPRCVTVCPTRALQSVKVDDEVMAARAKAEQLTPLRPDLGTKPRVYYRNLPRIESVFVAGSVVRLAGPTLECVENALVELFSTGKKVAAGTTDAFGDFRFDGLAARGGRYELRVAHRDFGNAGLAFELAGSSVVLGEVRLAFS